LEHALKEVEKFNELIKYFESILDEKGKSVLKISDKKIIKSSVYRPEAELDISVSDFDVKRIRELITLGYQEAAKYFEKIL